MYYVNWKSRLKTVVKKLDAKKKDCKSPNQNVDIGYIWAVVIFFFAYLK